MIKTYPFLTYPFLKDLRRWIKENGVSTIWEKLVIKPRNDHRPSFDVDRERCSFRAWVAVVLRNEAESARRRSREKSKDLSEQPGGPADKDADAVEKLRWLSHNLASGLKRLSKEPDFQSSGQRRNGVDYFAVLVIHLWLQIMRLWYKVLYEDKPNVACGQVVLNYVEELFSSQLWHERRPATRTRTVGEIIDQLNSRLVRSNEKPEATWITENLSQNSAHASSKNAREIWPQWVHRARLRYAKARNRNLLTPEEQKILDALLGADNTEEC